MRGINYFLWRWIEPENTSHSGIDSACMNMQRAVPLLLLDYGATYRNNIDNLKYEGWKRVFYGRLIG